MPAACKNEPGPVGPLLLIVSRREPRRFTYLKHVFGDALAVILDRRVEERRKRQEPATDRRRRPDRRKQGVTGDFGPSGWALIRR